MEAAEPHIEVRMAEVGGGLTTASVSASWEGDMRQVYDTLTARQEAVYRTILRLYQERGSPPTIREIGGAIGGVQPKAVVDHLKALERKGYLTLGAGKSRSIRFLGVGFRLTIERSPLGSRIRRMLGMSDNPLRPDTLSSHDWDSHEDIADE